MIVSSIPPVNSYAEPSTKNEESNSSSNSASNPTIDDYEIGEVIEKRTENEKVFYEGKGKYRKEIYFEPIHKKVKGKKYLEEISADLVEDNNNTDEINTENTIINTTFSKKMKSGHYAEFEIKGHKIDYSILSASGEDKEMITAKDVHAQYKKKTNKITHKNVFPNIDLQNLTFGQNVKEDLVLKSYNGYHIFKFKLGTDLDAEIQKDGSIHFFDKDSKKIFDLPKPFMTDSNYDDHKGEPQKSEDVKYELEKDQDGYILTVIANPDWLKAKERKYPVYIDPTTSINTSSDTFVMSAYPTTNYSSSTSKWDSGQGQYVLKTGYYDGTTGTTYGFLNHSITSFKNMNVSSATFNVYVTHAYYASTANGLWLDTVNSSWTASTLNWNNKPASTNIGKVDVARDSWAQFNVTNVVKEWASGAKTNYGFKLHTNGNGQTFWKKVVSTTNSNLKPYLSVTYTIPTASTPTGKLYSNGNGTGYANLSWSAVKGATGYKVWIFNGKEYESFSVGNVTSWSTKGKKIWPTAAEISAGKYDLHQDGTGTELAIDPSPVYKNSGGNYQTSKNYWFRVSAIFSQGEGPQSGYYKPTLPNLALPPAPTGTSYSNGNGTGYIDFKWKAVSGATGYKILLYNGKEYESLDVGNVTSWTTKGKKYWPTSSEISAGKYKLHLSDNAGSELAVNPAPVYKNSGGNYQTSTNYWIRVVAYNSQGETINSNAYKPSITSIKKPAAPTGFTYTNMLTSKSGYAVLNWDEIEGATGYKVWVFNGKSYQPYDVGDKTTWTSQNKGIWPTATEINEGKYTLHTDGKGAELAIDPSPVYKNSGGNYQTRKNYWFRISAYDKKGETIYSNALTPTFGEPVEFLGSEEYWSIIDVPSGKVNMATGNLMIEEDDFSLSGRGPSIGISRTYNSLSNSIGIFGPGWQADVDMSVTSSSDGKKVTLIDEDGTVHLFTKLEDGTFKAPTGVYLELTENNEHFVLKTKDQTNAHFSKAHGRLTKITDGYGNASTYTYDTAGKLTTITDASGRKLQIAYNSEGFVKTLTGPSDKKVTYEYKDGFLTKAIQTSGEVTLYEYNAGLLTKIYEPNHTEAKPVVNQYVYNSSTKHLTEATNPKRNKYILGYDLTNKSLLFTQPNGRKIKYSYNEAANPTEVIEDVDGLKIKTSYKYEGNNLIESKDPNDENASKPTEKYEYDSNGNVITATDSYGTETYEYNSNNDVTSVVDTEGDQTTIAYEGLDAVSETDQTGKTSSIAKYQKDTNGNSNGNLIESSYSLGTASNLLSNNNFENDLAGWTEKKSNDSGSISVDSTTKTYHGITGNKSIKMTIQPTSSSKGYIASTQEVQVEENTQYSLSGVIKTDLTKAYAFFNVEFLDSENKRIAWGDNRYSQITGNRTWTERQFSFKTPAKTAKVRIYLEVEHSDASASGTAWFDTIQLEKAEVSSSFNPVINSSFKSFTSWTGSGGALDSSNGFDDSSSLKVSRTSQTQAASEYKQTINVGQGASDTPLHLTLTGLSKADNVTKKGTVTERDYSIVGKVYYADGTSKEYISAFPIGTQEWNRTAVNIPADKPITKIDILTVFKGNYTGTVWFDDLRVIKGFVITKNKYDQAGNYVTESEDELGNKEKSSYDSYGNKLTETDAKGEVKAYQYDSSNQLKKLTLSTGTSIQYEYDKNGNMTSKKIVPSEGTAQEFTYQYDANGNLIETTGPLNEVTKNEYDANGNKVKTVLPNNQTLSWTYDGTDRIKNEKINDELVYEYTYDKNGNELSVVYSKENRTKNRVYDTSNRVTKQTDAGAIQEWKYSSTSDKLNEFILTIGSNVVKNTYQYNELDQNILVNDGQVNYRFDYDERGNVKTFTTGNGAGASFKYDDRGLVSQLVVGLANGNDVLDETHSYDENGNRTQIKYQNGDTITYKYGKLDQLEKEVLRDGTQIDYSYDGFGNRTLVKKTTKGQTTSITSEYNQANQLIKFGQESITYDANGNRTQDGQYRYTWNAKDQLVAINKVGETSPFVTYKYDEDGRRIQKVVNSGVTNYYYDGDSLNVLYETNANNEIVRSYVYSESGQLLSMRKGNAKYFYHYNAHGDVIALTNQQGEVVASYQYDAWGNPLTVEEDNSVADNPYRYAGYQFDRETGMYYLMARYYHPTHGVFLSLDPDPGDDDDILTQNGYTYANNNPVMLVDPDGHYFWLAVNAGFAAYDGYKAYKSGKSWKGVAAASAVGFIGGSRIKAAKKASHTVYTLTKKGKVVYVGRTKNPKSRKYAHSKKHKDATFTPVKSGLSYSQARGLEHRLYLKNGGKKKLRNKIRPISKKNKKYKHYMSASRSVYRNR